MQFLKILFAVIGASIVIYFLFSVSIVAISLWLKNKIKAENNPTDKELNPYCCSWYIKPLTQADYTAKKLIDKGFINYFESFIPLALLMLCVGVVVLLFVLYVINSFAG